MSATNEARIRLTEVVIGTVDKGDGRAMSVSEVQIRPGLKLIEISTGVNKNSAVRIAREKIGDLITVLQAAQQEIQA